MYRYSLERQLKYYLQIRLDGSSMGIWRWDGTCAQRVGVTEPLKHPSCHAIAEHGEAFLELMKINFPHLFNPDGGCSFHEMKLALGGYYPRMARPSDQHPKDSPGTSPSSSDYGTEVALMQGQLESLVDRLKQICQAVLPNEHNNSVYGHEIRNLLILACTEVESQWRSILVANGIKREKYTTNDYVMLSGPMRLREYSVLLSRYPWLPALNPFKEWGNSGKPTKELSWYDAYNSVKHAREENFNLATLEHCLQAVAACAVMNCAQFGTSGGFGNSGELKYFFQFSQVPKWEPSEVYSYPYGQGEGGRRSVEYPFNPL